MTAPVRRKTARERDRELIAKWAQWGMETFGYSIWPLSCADDEREGPDHYAALEAAARELNRIAKEARRGK